jgi:lysophospholipase L1-like esterase
MPPDTTPRTSTRGVFAKIVLLVASLLVAVVLVEVCLQFAAMLLQASGRDPEGAWLTSDVRVLALGDSNTFGLYLEAHETYPSQLEARWNESVHAPKIEVVNLGYPSTNSSRLLVNFDRLLDAFAPNVVLVQIGVNDYWTAPVEIDREESGGASLLGAIRTHSRLYKLIYILRRSAVDPDALEVGYNREAFNDRKQDVNHTGSVQYRGETFELSEPFAPGSKKSTLPMPPGNKTERLATNLAAMIRVASERSVALVLVTYPSRASFYGGANQVLRRVAAANHVALADPGRELEDRCPDVECPELFLPDHHATALGNEIVARSVLEVVAEQLGPQR